MKTVSGQTKMLPMPVILLSVVALALLTGCGSKSSSTPAVSNASMPGFEVEGSLNDTGIDLCASADAAQLPCPQSDLPNQDAEVGRDALARAGQLDKVGGGSHGFDWTKLNSAGAPLAIQDATWQDGGDETFGTHWTCLRDNVSGLVWEIKESRVAHPRFGDHLYSWYWDDETRNGGYAGFDQLPEDQCGTPPCHSQHYVEWVNAQKLCGFDDWRMPSVHELLSIAVNSKLLPALDIDYFPNASKPRFFTRQSLATDPMRAWYVYFSDASVSFTNKSDGSHIRLVRGGQ